MDDKWTVFATVGARNDPSGQRRARRHRIPYPYNSFWREWFAMNYMPNLLTVACTDCHLRRLPSFRDFEDDQVPTVEQLKVGHRRAERDSVLLRAGDEDAAIFTLFTGWAFRFRLLPDGRRQILRILLPGDTVGLELLLGELPAYSVQAVSDVAMCLLDAPHTTQRMVSEPWLRHRVFGLICAEREATDELLTRIGQCDAEERVAWLLLDLHARLQRRGQATEQGFSLALTQQHIADLLGLNVIHLNRVLRRLRGRELVAITGHKVTLLDIPALQRLAVALPARHAQQALL
jgi:CRP-like cAMP-binding protein